MEIRAEISTCWTALSWFDEVYCDMSDPAFTEKFEEMFNCKFVFENLLLKDGSKEIVPTCIMFKTEQDYTLFLLTCPQRT